MDVFKQFQELSKHSCMHFTFFFFYNAIHFQPLKNSSFYSPLSYRKNIKNGYCNFICSKTGSNVDDGKTHNIAIQLVNLQQCSKQVAICCPFTVGNCRSLENLIPRGGLCFKTKLYFLSLN